MTKLRLYPVVQAPQALRGVQWLVEGAWACRYPAKISAHIQWRLESLPTPLQDIGWKAQLRLCKRFRRLAARGKHHNVIVTATARELLSFMWAIAKAVPLSA